jgi:hypothetical protein
VAPEPAVTEPTAAPVEHAVSTESAQPLESILEGLADSEPVVEEPRTTPGGDVMEPLGTISNRP